MVEMTLQVPEDLAERIRPLGHWLPAILELSFVGCRTVAAATASEVIEFLARDPSPEAVLNYHASERSQERLRRLLALNAAGMLGAEELSELDELGNIEHIVVQLKARVAAQLPRMV